MKTEGEFNAWLSKKCKKMKPNTKYLKIADKFTVGISDFLIWRNGKTLAIESKFVKKMPTRGTSKILSHIFKGEQKTFLEDMELSGNTAYGVIGIHTELLVFIPHILIPESGNWTKEDFDHCKNNFEVFPWVDGFEKFLNNKLGEQYVR